MSAENQAVLRAAADGLIADSDMIIQVLSKRPLNFNAPDGLNVTVTGSSATTLDYNDAYLASLSGALLGTINVPGETRIKVVNDIANTLTGSSVSTGNLILESAQGSIGTSVKPLNLGSFADHTFTARAQDGVYVDFTGTAEIDTVFSPGDVTLDATGSLLNANHDLLINVLGKDLTLTAESGDIGAADNPLNVGNENGGGISAHAGRAGRPARSTSFGPSGQHSS